MSEIWRTRGDWNRTRVAADVGVVFQEVETDINMMQNVGQWSMDGTKGMQMLEEGREY